MAIWFPIPILIAGVFLLVRAERRTPRDVRQVMLWKPLSTLMVIAVCLLSLAQPPGTHDRTFTLLIAGGLVLSLLGDVLLIFEANPKAFLAGLVAFLVAHIAYGTAFVYLQFSQGFGINVMAEVVDAGALTLAAVAIYRYLSPGLGTMRVPVIAYMVIISVMVQRAFAVASTGTGSPIQSILIAGGALLFYLSDAILAVDKFRYGGKLRGGRVLNLSMYYSGQLLIALSASFFAMSLV